MDFFITISHHIYIKRGNNRNDYLLFQMNLIYLICMVNLILLLSQNLINNNISYQTNHLFCSLSITTQNST